MRNNVSDPQLNSLISALYKTRNVSWLIATLSGIPRFTWFPWTRTFARMISRWSTVKILCVWTLQNKVTWRPCSGKTSSLAFWSSPCVVLVALQRHICQPWAVSWNSFYGVTYLWKFLIKIRMLLQITSSSTSSPHTFQIAFKVTIAFWLQPSQFLLYTRTMR